MHSEHHIKAVQRIIGDWKRQGLSVGFVPTMGNLHTGHLSLVTKARQHTDKVVVSIFVNPLQFGPGEDFDSYPRTLEQDAVALAEAGVDLLFVPSVNEMYPHGREGQTQVSVPQLGESLEGTSRPGFFTGVATVVNKLFHCVPADVAVFGEKDYQQLLVIRRMVDDLNLPIEILAGPIVREANGLAMSSRNGYLSDEQRARAATLYQSLNSMREQIESGRRDFAALEQQAHDDLLAAGFKPDYVTLRSAIDLGEMTAQSGPVVLLAAASLGNTRLIDNISFEIQ